MRIHKALMVAEPKVRLGGHGQVDWMQCSVFGNMNISAILLHHLAKSSVIQHNWISSSNIFDLYSFKPFALSQVTGVLLPNHKTAIVTIV